MRYSGQRRDLSLTATILLMLATPLAAQTIGMIADNATKSVFILDADTDTVIGSVALTNPGSAVGDCSISGDQSRGFVTNFDSQVYVIDLTAPPFGLAAGTNPIEISNPGEDLAATSDGNCLVVCDGFSTAPVSSILIADGLEVDTKQLNDGVNRACNSVEVCSDGTVLATSPTSFAETLYRFTINAACEFSTTYDTASINGYPANVSCSPDSSTAVVTTLDPSADLRLFPLTPTLPVGPVDTEVLTSDWGVSTEFSSDGTILYARSFSFGGGDGHIDAYEYDGENGFIGAFKSGFPEVIGDAVAAVNGTDQMALNPDGSKLYVSQLGSVGVYDPDTGDFLHEVDEDIYEIAEPTGICFAPAPSEDEEPSYPSLVLCTASLIHDRCEGMTGPARADCNHEQQDECSELFP